MDVSVIIVNYNTAEITKQCIESIFSKTEGVVYEVIVVDNASSDNSDKILGTDRRILYLKSPVNLGFGKANNMGLKQAGGKYIFLLNSDTILRNNAIKIFFDYLESQNSNVAGIGTLLKATDGKTIGNSYGMFPSVTSTLHTLLSIYKRKPLQQNDFEKDIESDGSFYVDYIIGADIFLKREVIEKFGLFDPDFFMYFEETEMQFRYTKNGYRFKIFPKPDIIHLECASTNTDKKQYNFNQKYRFTSSWFIYMKKTQTPFSFFLFKLVMMLYLPIVVKRQNSLKQNIKLVNLFF